MSSVAGVFSQQLPPVPSFQKVNAPTGKSFLHVTGIAQDRLGYMWYATKRGLFRYNGYEMIHYKYDPLDPNSLPSDVLETISIDTLGNIWLGSLGAGLFKFDPVRQKFTRYQHREDQANSLSADWVSVVFCDRKGRIWVGTGNGLDRFVDSAQGFVHYVSKPNDEHSLSADEVVSIYEDRKGTIWVGTGSIYGPNRDNPSVGGLNRVDDINGKFTRFLSDPRDASTLISNKVHAIYESTNGTFWVGTSGDGLHTLNRKTGKFTRYKAAPAGDGLPARPPLTGDPFTMISFITEDAKGGLWIGSTDNGMNYYDPSSRRNIHLFPGGENDFQLGNANPWTAYTSAEGVFWVSTFGGDLYKFNPVQVKVPYFKVEANDISGIEMGRDGTFWVTSGQDGLLHFDTAKKLLKHYRHDPQDKASFRTNRLISLTSDRNGDLWIGTLGAGVEHFSTKTEIVKHYFRHPGKENTLSNDTVIYVYADEAGKIWAGTFRGLSVVDPKSGNVNNYLLYPGDTAAVGKNLTTSVVLDGNEKCWVSSFVGGGVHIVDQKTKAVKTFLEGISVAKLFRDSQGRLWVCAVEGLFYYDPSGKNFLRYNDPLGLTPILEVKSIIEDNEGNLWLSSGNNIMKISRDRDLVTLFDTHFGIDVDLTYGEIFSGNSQKLYFPAATGFYEISPAEFNKESKAPKIILSNFRLMNQPVFPGEKSVLQKDISVTENLVLKYHQNIFSFDFAAVDYIDPEANRHLFMLENYDETWNVPGYDRKAIYFNVPPGKYVFRVRAVNAYGKWSEHAVNIEIIPAWWSTWWFRIAVILTLLALTYFLIKWRFSVKYRLQMERSEQEKELSRLQHRAAKLEMHALRAQMNPHFLFNSLNSINRFIIQNNSEQASGYLTKFSRLMRLILQNSQHELIPLENEIEALKLYLELEAVRFDHHFSWNIRVDKDVDVAALKVPPLIIQPYAENAIWHGLMHKEEKGALLIELKQADDYLICVISDDGIGRKKAGELKSKSASTHKSMGMQITADRIASMKDRRSNENNIHITDLVLPDGTAAGTRVEIKIPLRYA